MTFDEALEKLDIVDYKERICNSNSRGELFHLAQYIQIATTIEDVSWFREFFIAVVDMANETWERPESVYQHIIQIGADLYDYVNKE